jgi:hypothetical protein
MHVLENLEPKVSVPKDAALNEKIENSIDGWKTAITREERDDPMPR